ncbi:hypothetical protein [Dellaglioa algida]|uniref:Uncharacterized protein n=1 Tax=Dellaglioa algida TaxID=105612 RepID=A0A5C6M9A5_9LACO|nr:hypothetical protein [Dellaglioa algida]MDK1716709.1 hypothetical protein [Dellaglioa algida]MDK1720156.1 hypothetical protein [Dellaglioa algida]MDK1721651.1 hypothetical protein [Dellaglioa algida]MDK1723545.1 hypothetical protein [Dellaglioa algida]MDK1725179.1 hypothetical protein [Dellaglioa algida]
MKLVEVQELYYAIDTFLYSRAKAEFSNHIPTFDLVVQVDGKLLTADFLDLKDSRIQIYSTTSQHTIASQSIPYENDSSNAFISPIRKAIFKNYRSEFSGWSNLSNKPELLLLDLIDLIKSINSSTFKAVKTPAKNVNYIEGQAKLPFQFFDPKTDFKIMSLTINEKR